MNPYDTLRTFHLKADSVEASDLDTTMTRALSDAELASLAAAKEAHERGEIPQREVLQGVWKLTRGRDEVQS